MRPVFFASEDFRHLLIDGRTDQPADGHYVLEFDHVGVVETSPQNVQPKILSGGYWSDLNKRVPNWVYLISITLFFGGSALAFLSIPGMLKRIRRGWDSFTVNY